MVETISVVPSNWISIYLKDLIYNIETKPKWKIEKELKKNKKIKNTNLLIFFFG